MADALCKWPATSPGVRRMPTPIVLPTMTASPKASPSRRRRWPLREWASAFTGLTPLLGWGVFLRPRRRDPLADRHGRRGRRLRLRLLHRRAGRLGPPLEHGARRGQAGDRHPVGGAGDVVEADALEEVDRVEIAAVLAAHAE